MLANYLPNSRLFNLSIELEWIPMPFMQQRLWAFKVDSISSWGYVISMP
jgi:hypothetical protein